MDSITPRRGGEGRSPRAIARESRSPAARTARPDTAHAPVTYRRALAEGDATYTRAGVTGRVDSSARHGASAIEYRVAAVTLSPLQLDAFARDGYVRLDAAFAPETAAAARAILWRDLGLAPDDPSGWTRPVVRLGMYTTPPFVEAANTLPLHQAFDQLVGVGRWRRCMAMGTFPVRFPSPVDPGDGGWHVDAGFPGADPVDYFAWRVNAASRGRALLMLFLFSDVSDADAPTRIRVGSQRDVADLLANQGDAGMSFLELAESLAAMPPRDEALATGPAGTVYLCHPFLVHAAQPHRGAVPRFMAQPPLLADGDAIRPGDDTPLARAVREAPT